MISIATEHRQGSHLKDSKLWFSKKKKEIDLGGSSVSVLYKV